MRKKNGAEKIPGSETDFKRKFRQSVLEWSEAYEPSRGSGTGYPDVQVLLRGVIVPVEVKIALVSQGVLWSRDIRPAQIGWHYRLMKAGGKSAFVFGVLERKLWSAYVFPVCEQNFERLMAWREGFDVNTLRVWDWKDPRNVASLIG